MINTIKTFALSIKALVAKVLPMKTTTASKVIEDEEGFDDLLKRAIKRAGTVSMAEIDAQIEALERGEE